MSAIKKPTEMQRRPAADTAEPAWDVARLFPNQGTWSVEEYLDLDTNQLVEFSHGFVEVLPMPTQSHQFIALFLYRVLLAFATARKLGHVLAAPFRIQLWPGKFREPDVVFLSAEHTHRRGEQFWEGADLVMEVVSPDNREHDLVTKRREYARAGIPEYWIVDPQEEMITILTLAGDSYAVHGEFGRGADATSVLLEGFVVSVDEVLEAAEIS